MPLNGIPPWSHQMSDVKVGQVLVATRRIGLFKSEDGAEIMTTVGDLFTVLDTKNGWDRVTLLSKDGIWLTTRYRIDNFTKVIECLP